MSIKYALFKNHLTADPDDYAAIVQIAGSVDLDKIADRIVAHGSTVGRADVLATLELAVTVCEEAIDNSEHINFGGLVDMYPRVKGVFVNATDPWDPARHRAAVGANAGVRVRKHVREQAQVERVEALKPAPNLVAYADTGSGDTDDTVTVGNMADIVGNRLKFDTSKADEGVYFIADADGAATKVTDINTNKPSKLIFLNPATLVPGTYKLEVRARMGRPPAGVDNRELRVGRLDATLTV